MELNDFSLICIIFLQMVLGYSVFKILFRNKSFQRKEFFSLIIGALVIGNLFLYLPNISTLLMNISLLIIGMIFVYSKKLYITGVLSYAMVITVLCDHTASMLDIHFWKHIGISSYLWIVTTHMFTSIGLSLFVAVLVIYIRPSIEKKFLFFMNLRQSLV